MPGIGDGGERRMAEAIAAMAELCGRAEAGLSGLPPEQAFARLTELRDALERLRKRAARSRARAASDLYGSMSLADVAATLGLTRARIDQLVREARGRPRPSGRKRKARGEGTPASPSPDQAGYS